MISRIYSVAFDGITPQLIDVQVHITKGLPSFNIVGLADKSVNESKERVRSAFSAIGLGLPAERITVNLSPADLLKEGSHFDLPIALALLGAMELLPKEELIHYIAIGEISLDASVNSVNGVLAASLLALEHGKNIIFPYRQLRETFLVKNQLELLAINNVLDIINHYKSTPIVIDKNIIQPVEYQTKSFTNLADIKGHETAKQVLEITAAGAHNLLMIGPPGSGKSMLANAIGSILPPLSEKEILDLSLIYSVAGELKDSALITSRPYRAPHHSASMPALIGGGQKAKPGEITLAHSGILFLDELAEFNKHILDALRQPLETKHVNIARVNRHVSYPANFQLIAAMNPCRCGYFGDDSRECGRAPDCMKKYQAKISGPILDRIDLTIDVPNISVMELNNMKSASITSEMIKQKVVMARKIQAKRFQNFDFKTNNEASNQIIEDLFLISVKAKDILNTIANHARFSTRSYLKMMKVARTCADLQESHEVHYSHMSQALSYRIINAD